jgi:hypothetical protein
MPNRVDGKIASSDALRRTKLLSMSCVRVLNERISMEYSQLFSFLLMVEL